MNEFEYPKAIMLNGNLKNPADGQVDYWGLFYKFVLSKWYLYLAFGILCVGLAYVFYKKQQPVYEITSKLLIREREEDYGPGEDFVKNNINFSASSEKVTNEIELLTSFSLINAVVEELDLGTKYSWKHKLSEYDVYQGFPIAVDTFVLNSREENSFQITPINPYSFQFSLGSKTETHHFGEFFSNQYGKFRINRVEGLPISSDSTMHVTFWDPQEVATWYQESLGAELSDEKNKSTVIILSLRDAVPQRGIDVLSMLIDKFNQLKNQANTELTLKTLELLDTRLATIGAELTSAENRVEDFKLNNDIISETSTDLDITMENVNDVAKEQRSIESQLKMIQSMRSDLQDTSDNFQLLPINPNLFDGRLQDLVQPYNDGVVARERLLLQAEPSNPVVQISNQKLRSLRSSIRLAVNNLQGDLSAKLGKLQNQYDLSYNRLRSVPSKERGLSGKLRAQEIKENLYVNLLQKREETALTLASNYSNALLVDAPHSTLEPVAPKKTIIFLTAGMGGVAIPFFLILLLDLFKGLVRTEKDIKQIIPDREILGIINHHKGQNQKALIGHEQSLATERFRSLRTSLQFQHRESSKCILVTSSTSGEGKTFVATNLARSFALAKKKTIILDFDLRRPSINKYFKGNPEIGLSTYFMGALNEADVIQTSVDIPTLDYISGGPAIPNLVESITEQQLTDLFSYLKAKYDVIIIDTSPIGIISDGILLNSFVDKSLFVVRSGYSKKITVEKAKEIFRQNKLVNPSIIFNGVKKQNDSYRYGYKHYGYNYN